MVRCGLPALDSSSVHRMTVSVPSAPPATAVCKQRLGRQPCACLGAYTVVPGWCDKDMQQRVKARAKARAKA